jgi:Matrixin
MELSSNFQEPDLMFTSHVKKVLALAVLGAVMAVPAQALAQPRWYRGTASQVTVYFERTRVSNANWEFVRSAGWRWSRSSRIRVVLVAKCPRREYCVKITEGRYNTQWAGRTTLTYDPKTNTAWWGTIKLNTRYLYNRATRRMTTCHEMGHALGLSHRHRGRSCMRASFATMYGKPDATDYKDLRRIYAR